MSALHNGQVRTMKANYKIEAGDVRVIRPLIYVREHMTRDFSQTSKLPIINENCPACFEQPKVENIIYVWRISLMILCSFVVLIVYFPLFHFVFCVV